jgi:hypothetical protein
MRHFLNGIEVSPRNIDSIGFSSKFDDSITIGGDNRELSINVDTIVLPNEARDIINNWVAQNGIFQGIPYQLQLSTGLTVEYYGDLVDSALYKDRDITLKLKRRKAFDNFFENAQSTTFELLKAKGVNFNSFNIPYIIVPPNQVEIGIVLSLSAFVMTKATIEAITKTAELVVELIGHLTPLVGVGVVIQVSNIIATLIKLTLQLAYTIALIIALKKLLDQLRELIFPKVRNFLGCKVKELISKGCNQLGYTFESTLLDSLSGLTILPVPLVKEKHKGFKSIFDHIQNDLNFAFTKGYPTAQDTTPTLWSLIEAVETTFNAKTRVVNGVVRTELKTYWEGTTTNQIESSLVLQNERQDKYILNTADVWKRYYLHYQPDYSDINTLDNFEYNDAEYSTEPLNVVNSDLITIKGLQDRSIPFALGTRKEKLNYVESLTKKLLKVIDSLAGTSFASQIDKRVGVLVVSQQFYSVTKLMYTVNGKQPSNYSNFLSPTKLWENYHYLNQIQINGYKIKESVKFLMNDEKFVNLLNNNWVDIDGVKCEIISMEYIDRDSYALITYKEPFDYASMHVKTIKVDE